MSGFRVKTRQNLAAGSPRSVGGAVGSPRLGEVGEIDTRSPIRSVRAAASLFGEVATPKASPSFITRSKILDGERVVSGDKFKQQLKVTENTKLQALRELEKANETLQELKIKIKNVVESKQAALESTEASKARAKQLEQSKSTTRVTAEILNEAISWNQDVDSEMEVYKASAKELESTKHELTKLRRDFEVATKAKVAAFQEAADAKNAAKVNRDKLTTLSKEIGSMRAALAQIKHASTQSKETHSKIMAEKNARLRSKRSAKEVVEKKISTLKAHIDCNSEMTGKLQEMLDETNEAIAVLKDQLRTMHDSDLDSLRIATSEVDEAKKMLEQVIREKNWLRSLVESLKVELEQVKRDKKELMEKVKETALLSDKLEVELVNSREEREAALAGETKEQEESLASIRSSQSRIQELNLEAANAKKEAEALDRKTEALNQEAECFRTMAKQTDEKLIRTMKQAEEAKKATEHANTEFFHRNLSLRLSSSTDITSGDESISSSGKIKLTVEEFEILKGKAKWAGRCAEKEVMNAMAQVEAINRREKEARERSDEMLKMIERMKEATHQSLKQADMAEVAKRAVEAELLLHIKQPRRQLASKITSCPLV